MKDFVINNTTNYTVGLFVLLAQEALTTYVHRIEDLTASVDQALRGFGLSVEPGEFFDVQTSVAVAVEVLEQERDS